MAGPGAPSTRSSAAVMVAGHPRPPAHEHPGGTPGTRNSQDILQSSQETPHLTWLGI